MSAKTHIVDHCRECGMPVSDREYHPYAACLMFKGGGTASDVRANLKAVLDRGKEGKGLKL